MEKPKYFQKHGIISLSVPLELKVELIENAKLMGTSLSDYVYTLIAGEAYQDKKTEELSQLKAENQQLKERLQELENAEPSELPEPYENEFESVKEYAENLQEAYCKLKHFAFDAFSDFHFYKWLEAQMIEDTKDTYLPNVKKKATEALNSVLEALTAKNQNIYKDPKEKTFAMMQKAFLDKFEIESIFSELLAEADAETQKIYFQQNAEDILQGFNSNIDKIEYDTISEENYNWEDVKALCKITIETDPRFSLEHKITALNQKYLEQKSQKQKTLLTKPTPIITPVLVPAAPTYTPKGKDEAILHELYQKGKSFITIPELKELGFNVGFWGNLTARGGKYGKYKLEKEPSEKVYKILLK